MRNFSLGTEPLVRTERLRFLVSSAAVAISTAFTATVVAQQPATAASLVLDGVTVIDVESGARVPGQRVVVVGHRIKAVGAAGAVKVPAGAQTVDARGKYLIPGLWDLHTHAASDREDALFIAFGITGFRNAGTKVTLETLRGRHRDVLAGVHAGPPRQLLSGLQLNGPGNPLVCPEGGGSSSIVSGATCVRTPDDVRRVVDSLKAAGADMIKTYILSPEMHFALAAEARRAKLPIAGHSHTLSAMMFSDSGGTILDHVRNAGNPNGVAASCASDSATLEQCRAVAERFTKNGTWWAPTLIRSLASSSSRAELKPGLTFDSLRARVLGVSRQLNEGTLPPRDWLRGMMDVARHDSMAFFSIVQRAGIPLLAATDDTPGPSLHAELALYVAEGLSPLEALQSATLNPAKMLRATDSLGTVAPGKLADLVLLDADPIADITHTTAIHAVIANGRYFDRAALDRLLIETP